VKRTKSGGRRRLSPAPARKATAKARASRRPARAARPSARKTVALGRRKWNADPKDVERSLAQLVLSLVEFLRQLMERQAVRRMEEGTLDADEIESMGVALMKLEETLHELAARFGLKPSDLNLDLGPLGRLT
jgi:hypothetical protein